MKARHGGLLGVMAAAVLLSGLVFAGGADCHGKPVAEAGHKHAGHEGSCPLMKNVTKTAKMTDDGAVVTLVGKTDDAVKMIHEHLAVHGKEHECEGCPVTMDGVSANININDTGGVVTLSGSTPDAVKAVKEWAAKPAGSCCSGKKTAA